jgi:hypothetical protein
VHPLQAHPVAEPPFVTILVIPLPDRVGKPATDWAAVGAKLILRHCPICDRDTIIGHGCRSKQAHDQNHDWIRIRRGQCNICEKTFTFLPSFSLPYTHYSLLARSEALCLHFVEGLSWENSAPTLQDPDRVAHPSTLRRWARSLDAAATSFLHLRQILTDIRQRISGGAVLGHGEVPLPWPTVALCLHQFWPWPLRL